MAHMREMVNAYSVFGKPEGTDYLGLSMKMWRFSRIRQRMFTSEEGFCIMKLVK